MPTHFPLKVIARVQIFALARLDTLDLTAEFQFASKVVPTVDGAWRLTLVSAHQVTVELTVACLYATKDFLYRIMSCLNG